MKQLLNSRPFRIFLAVASLILISSFVLTTARGVSIGELIGSAIPDPIKPQVVVARVNGEAISLATIEMTRLAFQAMSKPPLSTREAYKKALEHQIRETVLRQEARRRGIQVTDQEAKAAWEQNNTLLQQSPEAQKLNEEMARGAGLTRDEFQARQIQTIKEGLLAGKLLEELARQAPEPTTAEINTYLAKQPKPNALIAIPIEFGNQAEAENLYNELLRIKQSQSLDQFTTTFDQYARQIGKKGPSEFVHESFSYTDASELSDFAKDALGKQEGDLGLYRRPDGSAVVYLVLKNVVSDLQSVSEGAIELLKLEKQNNYVQGQVDKWINAAQIQIFNDRLPSEAR